MKTHKTRDGQEMFIYQMGDEHLRNTVRSIVSRIQELNNVYSKAMSNALFAAGCRLNIQNMLDRCETLWEQLDYYLLEEAIRGDCTSHWVSLKIIAGRDGRIDGTHGNACEETETLIILFDNYLLQLSGALGKQAATNEVIQAMVSSSSKPSKLQVTKIYNALASLVKEMVLRGLMTPERIAKLQAAMGRSTGLDVVTGRRLKASYTLTAVNASYEDEEVEQDY